MGNISVEILLLILSCVVVVSYLFSILSRFIKVPSVLLLLLSGILLRLATDANNIHFRIPEKLVEFLGIVGLTMIVLEAGLDLKLGKDKVPLVRNSFFSALFIFVLSTAGIAAAIHFFVGEEWKKAIVYAIPLSIMSSSIVIPSLHSLSPFKKEFLIYEASFSDIIGILVFNYFIGSEILSVTKVSFFFLNIFIAVILSLIFSALLFLILTRSKLNIRFFLVFALLIFLYVGGKMMHLPSLIIILMFGLLMNNWHLVKLPGLDRLFPQDKVYETTHLLHSLTAESSFLIRTFFFVLFGYNINLSIIASADVVLIGSIIVVLLLLVRFLYLRFFLKEQVFPEVFFIPRGLITILLFYKIPLGLKLSNFNEGILFFVILVTGIIMTLGMVFYKYQPEETLEGP